MGTLRISGSPVTLNSKYRVTVYTALNPVYGEGTLEGDFLKFTVKGLPEGAKITGGKCSCLVSAGRRGTYAMAGVTGATEVTLNRSWEWVKNGSGVTVGVTWKATPSGDEEGAPYPGKEYSAACRFQAAILELTYQEGSSGGGGGGDHEDIGQSGSLIFPVSPGKTGSGFFYYPEGSTNFSRNGLALRPGEVLIEGQDNGEFSASLQLLMEDNKKWQLIGRRGILRMPAPARKILTASAESNAPKLDQLTASAGRGYLYLYSAPTSLDGKSYNLGRVNNGEKLIKISEVAGENGKPWYRATAEKSGITGYCAAADVTASGSAAEQKSLMQMQERDQLFRIWDIEMDEGSGILSIQARHIFYDLSKAILIGDGAKIENVTIQAALQMLRDCADHPIPFSFYTDCAGTVTGDFRGKNIVEALLDPEDGLCAQVGAHISRDNFDVYLMQSLRENRGVRIEHGRNVEGAKCTYSSEKTANRIIAVMDGTYTVHDDEKRGSEEEILAVFRKYDKKNGSAQEQAKAEFESGLAGVDFEMEVDFVLLSETSEYPRYAGLQKLFLGDEMQVTLRQGSFLCEMTGYIYNSILKKYDSVTVGATAVDKSRGSIGSYQIGGMNAGKILGQIGGEQIKDGAIDRLKIQEALIRDLNAESIEALSAKIEELAAGNVTTDKLYAALATIASAQITAANIDKANIQWAEIASLSAKIAEIAKAQITEANINEANIQWANIASLSASIAQIVTAKIQTADIDFAHIKDLAADTAIITKGVGGELYISRLAVTEANMVSLSVGQLLVKGQDGGFYALSVDASGNITTEKKQVGNGDVQNLSINAGEKLIEGSVTAVTLNAKDIFADSAIIRSLIAANLDVDTLFAREATIAKLNTADISGNEYLRLSVKKAVDDIEIGGRNLLKNSKGDFRLLPLNTGASSDNFQSWPFSFIPVLGETYTFSADVEITDGNFDKISVYPYPSEYAMLTHVPIPANGRIVHTFTARHDTITMILVYAGIAGQTRGNGVIFRNVKIEKGNKATDWTAAPEDTEAVIDGLATRVTEAEAEIAVQAGEIQMAVSEINNISVGGRNLLLDSGREVTNNLYTMATYAPETPLVPGETYAFSLCVTPGANVTHIVPYVSGGNVGLGTFYVNGTEKQTVTFIDKMRDYYPGCTPEDNIANANVYFVRFPNDGTTGSTTIHWVKIEKGNKATDWTPAPEDPVQTLKNTAMTLNADGIDMTTTGHFRLYANDGKNSRIKLGGDNETANFSVDETGALGAVSGDFAQGLSVGNYPVWTKQNIIISSNEPTGVHDVLWIQPLQGVQQAIRSCVNTSQTHFTGGNAISYSLSPETSDVLSSGGNYSYSLSLRMTLGEDTTTVKTFTVSAVLSTSAGSVTLSGVAVSLSGWKTTPITLTGTSSVNLCAAKNNITAAVKVSGGSGSNTYMYIPRNTSLILTSKNTAASSAGAQTCTIHYIQ